MKNDTRYYVTVRALEPHSFANDVLFFRRRTAHVFSYVTRCALRGCCSAMLLG
jgi:hypothetical protein